MKPMARRLVTEAIKAGLLTRPEACGQCGSKGEVQAHHGDYSKPLEVVWLCTICHGKVHKAPTRRDTVIQIRVSFEEKERIEQNARAHGYGLSEYLRLRGLKTGSSITIDKSVLTEAERQAPEEAPKEPYRPSHPVTDEVEGITVAAPQQLYRCPVHHDSLRPSPSGRCFCNRKTSELYDRAP